MELFENPRGRETRWVSFENTTGAKGKAAMCNRGAKGSAFSTVAPFETKQLLNFAGRGIIRRIWMTLNKRSPHALRSIVLRMYWDACPVPAVECPLADFFGFGLATVHPVQSELFASPEGRSLNCFIPMPFFEHARITLTNETDTEIKLFYDINLTLEDDLPKDSLYFHAFFRREPATALEEDYCILPRIEGHGRFLGTSLGVLADARYMQTWFGEGEVKMYIDHDDAYPTLAGTGIEDYIGTAWGQGEFEGRTQGSTESSTESGRFSFYRWHTVDPVYFASSLRVCVQQIGGAPCKKALELAHTDVPIRFVSADSNTLGFIPLYENDAFQLTQDNAIDDAWYNFYRSDDYASTAYFFLDTPSAALPALPAIDIRTFGFDPNEPCATTPDA